MALLEIRDLCKKFKTGKKEKVVLSSVNMTVEAGTIVGVIGLSGEGKSTLVRCINGMERHDSGTITYNGNREFVVDKKLKGKALREYRREVAMIFQDSNLLAQKNVMDNIALPLRLQGVRKDIVDLKVLDIIRELNLTEVMHNYPSQLSGGQRQRVAIARAVITDPAVLLCDEATSALDPNTANQILDLLKKLNQERHITVIVIAHQMSVIERICDQVVVLSSGTVAEAGPVEEVFTNPKAQATKQLLYNKHIIKTMSESKLIRLTFDGDVETPIITNIVQDCNMLVSVVYANSWSVEDKVYGQIVIRLPYYAEDIQKLTSYLNHRGIKFEEVSEKDVSIRSSNN